MRSALGVDEFPRRDHIRDTNDVDFTKDIAKSLADRCKSRLTIKMSNATLSKPSTQFDENDDFSLSRELFRVVR